MEAVLIFKHFVEFLCLEYHEQYICGVKSQEVKERDPNKIEIPSDAFCFWFYDKIVGHAIADGNTIPIASEDFNKSVRYFYGGRVFSIEEIEKMFPENRTLINVAQMNHYKRMIQCRNGNWQSFGDNDILIEEKLNTQE